MVYTWYIPTIYLVGVPVFQMSETRFVVWKILTLVDSLLSYPHDPSPKIFVYSPTVTCAARTQKGTKTSGCPRWHWSASDLSCEPCESPVSHGKINDLFKSLNWHSAQFQSESFLSGNAAGLTLHVSHILPAGIGILAP
jgi:hypothetical protein